MRTDLLRSGASIYECLRKVLLMRSPFSLLNTCYML